MIIVFLIDTSASMNQRVYHGGHPRFIDIAKGAVETFVKSRQKSLESRQTDRYMLVTFDEPPDHIKAGWKESLNTFTTEVKNLQCCSMTNVGAAVKRVFELLNVNRMQTGIDAYGHGRNPYYLEPTMIILITDGGRLSHNSINELSYLQQSTCPSLELTKDAYRWDQRLFAMVLRFTGTPIPEREICMVPNDNSVLEAMCEMTGGRSYCITSQRTLMQCIESLLQKVQHGVVINFEKYGPDPPALCIAHTEANKDTDDSEHGTKSGEKALVNGNPVDGQPAVRNNFVMRYQNQPVNTAWHSCRKLIYVRRDNQKNSCFWPIPESFWPDASSTLPQRSAHPNIRFNCIAHDALIVDNLPFDKYELEPSPLTQYILARRQPTVCWQCFVPNSNRNPETTYPFGYLKASTNLTCVNLYVMPYNYPMLFPILEEIIKVYRVQKPIVEVKQQFQNYLRTVPLYYMTPLRKALERMGLSKTFCSTLLPDQMDQFYNFNISNYMKKMKAQGKIDFDKLCNEISNKVNSNGSTRQESIRVLPHILLSKEMISHPTLRTKFANEHLKDFSGHIIAVSHKHQQTPCKFGPQAYRNPFDIPRSSLIDHIFKMRSNFMQKNVTYTKLLDDDMSHSMLVTQMGNYQEYLKRKGHIPLREIEITQVRQHTFGNPFKIEKKMIVDEADVDMQRSSSRRSNEQSYAAYKMPSRKRKAGPIPRSFVYKRRHYSGPIAAASTLPSSYATSSVSSSYSTCDISPLTDDNPMSNASEIIVSCDSDDEDDQTDFHKNSDGNKAGVNNYDNDDDDDDDDDVDDAPLVIAEDDSSSSSSSSRSPSPPPLDIPSAVGSESLPSNYNEDIPPPSLFPISDIDDANGGNLSLASPLEKCNGFIEDDIQNETIVNRIDNDKNDDRNNNHNPNNNRNNYNNRHNSNNIDGDLNCRLHNVNGFRSTARNNCKEAEKNKFKQTPNKQEMEDNIQYNFKVKALMFKDVRSYGTNYKVLLQHMQMLRGTNDMKVRIIEEIIKELYKFKRTSLANKVKDVLEKFLMLDDDNDDKKISNEPQ